MMKCSINLPFFVKYTVDAFFRGSYSPRHIRKKWVNPNMSRRRLRGVVTPPASLIDDSDSESDMALDGQFQFESTQQNSVVEHSVSFTQSNNFMSGDFQASKSFTGQYEADQLDFSSDGAELGDEEPSANGSVLMSSKDLSEKKNRRIKKYSQGLLRLYLLCAVVLLVTYDNI